MNKYIQAVDDLMKYYDAYYFQNKYAEIEQTTHREQFKLLIDLLGDDEMSMKAISWIKNCYDCYYVNEYINDNDSAFAYLKFMIKQKDTK